jgi:hypothetical protein
MTLYEPPVNYVAGTALAILALYGAVAGVSTMRSALARSDALHLIRGIRVLIIGFVAALCTLSVAAGNSGFLILALLILAEELYETGILAAIIRLGDRPEHPARGPAALTGESGSAASRHVIEPTSRAGAPASSA